MHVDDATENANVTVFTNPEFNSVRTVVLNGEPYFVGKDIAGALGYSNPQKALRDHVDDEDRTVNESFTVNGTKGILVNESGLYALILSSRLPSAKRFKRWVTSEVLPQLRKTGRYATNGIDIPLTTDEVAKYLVCRMSMIDEQNKNLIKCIDNITYAINRLTEVGTSAVGFLSAPMEKEAEKPDDLKFVNTYSKKDIGRWRKDVWKNAEKISVRAGKDPRAILKRVYDSIEKDGVAIRDMYKKYYPVGDKRSMINMCSEDDALRKKVNACFNKLAQQYYPEMFTMKNVMRDDIPISQKMFQTPEEVRNLINVYAEKHSLRYNNACLKIYNRMNELGNFDLRKLSKEYAMKHGCSECRTPYYIYNTPGMMDLLKKVVEE